jgi:MFS transporter, SP family, general alpha glucoside:H+ symporter
MAEATTSPSEKHEEMRIEGARTDLDDVKVDGYDSYGLVKSRYDELSIPRTLWVFKRVVLVSLAVYTGYVCEGFELGAGGSVIANAGFIKQFGSEGGAGVRALNPTWGKKPCIRHDLFEADNE